VCDLPGYLTTIGRPRHMWKDNIKMDLKIGYKDVDWIHLTENGDKWWVLVNTVMKVSQNSEIFQAS
jgi:hypothetical protein